MEEYRAVEEAARKFVRSVAEGNSRPARELFIDEAGMWRCAAKAYNQNSNTIQK